MHNIEVKCRYEIWGRDMFDYEAYPCANEGTFATPEEANKRAYEMTKEQAIKQPGGMSDRFFVVDRFRTQLQN